MWRSKTQITLPVPGAVQKAKLFGQPLKKKNLPSQRGAFPPWGVRSFLNMIDPGLLNPGSIMFCDVVIFRKTLLEIDSQGIIV